MAKQDWTTRLEKVWVLGYDGKDGFRVEVYETKEAALREAAAFAL